MATENSSSKIPTAAVQWARDGNPLAGSPGEISRFLADADGKSYGYGYGPGWSMVFGSSQGDISLEPGDWLVRYSDGSYSVERQNLLLAD